MFTSCRQVVFALLVPKNTQVVTCLQTSCYRSANKLLQICSQAVDKLCLYCLFPKTHKLLHVCKQVVTNLFTSCRQVVFALLVPKNTQVAVTCLQTSCYMSANKLLQICSQAVDKLCSHCLFPKTHKLLHVCKQVVPCLQTSCYKSVHKLSTSCVRTICSQLL
jgi:hypothetical protein